VPLGGRATFVSPPRIEGQIYYPFHPRCGESVLIARQYAYRDAELVVIPQPDGSVACIPAWMTSESAAHHQLRAKPRLSLDILCSRRAKIDALLSFLHTDLGMENAKNEAQRAQAFSRTCSSRTGRASYWSIWSVIFKCGSNGAAFRPSRPHPGIGRFDPHLPFAIPGRIGPNWDWMSPARVP
jgi:hypothetical protein